MTTLLVPLFDLWFDRWFDPIIWPQNNHFIKDGGGWVEFNRVNGALAMSRALGDFFFKQNLDAPLHKQIVTGKNFKNTGFSVYNRFSSIFTGENYQNNGISFSFDFLI